MPHVVFFLVLGRQGRHPTYLSELVHPSFLDPDCQLHLVVAFLPVFGRPLFDVTYLAFLRVGASLELGLGMLESSSVLSSGSFINVLFFGYFLFILVVSMNDIFIFCIIFEGFW